MAWNLKDKSKSLIIGILNTGTVSVEWALKLRFLQIPVGSVFCFRRGEPIDTARNAIAKTCLEDKALGVFFLDSDVIVIDESAPIKMIQTGLPIISGVYRYKKTPFYAHLYFFDSESELFYPIPNLPHQVIIQTQEGVLLEKTIVLEGKTPIVEYQGHFYEKTNETGLIFQGKEYLKLKPIPDGSIIKVDGIGMGLTFIRREVFEALEYPYFKFERYGEDLYFCRKASKAGFSIYVDTSIWGEHVEMIKFSRSGVLEMGV